MFDWSQVKSSVVPQGSVLGMLLFIIFIHDIDDDISGMILQFVDDTKMLGRQSGNGGETDKLKNVMKGLYSWSLEWQMVFNAEKFKVIHFTHGNMHGNINFSYEMSGLLLEFEDEVRELVL